MVLVLLLSLVLSAAPEGIRAQWTKPVPTGTGSIAGRVIDRQSEQPLNGVIVTVMEQKTGGILKTTTAADGIYKFEGLGPGNFRVSAEFAGYAPQTWPALPRPDGRVDPEAIRVRGDGGRLGGGFVFLGLVDGQARTGVNFALMRGGGVAGRVTNDLGQPLKGALVRAMRTYGDTGYSFSDRDSAVTTERGEYEIRDLEAGTYRVAATFTDPKQLAARAGADMRLTFYPGTAQEHEAATVEVRPGITNRPIDIPMVAYDRFRLSGHVLRAGSDGPIEAHLLSPSWKVRTVSIGDDGAFDVTHVAPGRHTLWARAETPEGSEAAWFTVELESDLVGLALPMLPTGEIRGRVLTESGSPVPISGLQIIAELIDDGVTDPRFKSVDPLPRDKSDIGTDGSFVVRGLFAERRFRLSGNDWEVARVIVGRTSVETLSFAQGERLDGVVVVARRR